MSRNSSDDDFSLDFNKYFSIELYPDAWSDLQRAKLNVNFSQEVQAFLLKDWKDSPLERWNCICFEYSSIARVARKWFAVTATPSSSVRVFLVCGLTHIAKDSQMLGELIQAQVFVHNNYDEEQQLYDS